MQSLATIIGQEPQVWFGKQKNYHVSHATYSTYNAFRKLDLRVKVAFPGSVDWEVLDAWGNQASSDIIAAEEVDIMWEECYISSIVRSLITSDDDGDFSSIVEIRRINPFLDPKTSIPAFLKGFEHLYHDGEKLGCNEDVQVPSRLNNYLVDSFIKCIELTHCYDDALDVLYRLFENFPEISALIAKVLFLSNRELEAVKFIHDKLSVSNSSSVSEIPGASHLLLLQSEYCLEKSRPDLALPLAIRSVETSPSLFAPWAHLVKIYIALGKFEDALLTLNACPMVTHKDKYVLKRIATGAAERLKNENKGENSSASSSAPSSGAPSQSDMHLPLPQDVFLRGVTDLNSSDVAVEHAKLTKSNSNLRRTSDANSIVTPQSLLTLPAGSLKSTFRKAYSLLADIVHRLGWEGMLNTRAKVFVMEEEWRRDSKTSLAANSTSQVALDNSSNGTSISNEFRKKRLCERWLDNLFMLLYEDMKAYTYCRAQEMQAESMSDEPINSNLDASNVLSVPTGGGGGNSNNSETLGLWGGIRSRSNSTANSSSKDSKLNTKSKIDPYTESRSCLEWELLGLVCERLGHVRDAQRCYERALARRFSVRAARKLVGIYGRWRERARKQIGIQGKLQYAALTNNNNASNKETVGLLGQSKWNTSTMSVSNTNTNNENVNINAVTQNGHSNSSSLSITHNNNSTKFNTSTVINNHVIHVRDPMRYDVALLRLTVGLLVWDHRWYTLFSPLLLNTLSNVVNDLGVTKVESEVRVWFDDIRGNRGVFDIVNLSITVLESWGRVELEN